MEPTEPKTRQPGMRAEEHAPERGPLLRANLELSGQALAVQQMFDRIAPRYDLLNRLLSFRQDVKWRRTLVRRLPTLSPQQQGGHQEASGAAAPEGCSLLDLACGTGDVVSEVMARRPDYGRIVGFDLSREMLSRAALRLAPGDRGVRGPALQWIQGTATRLPFADQSFDAVTMAFGLRNVDDRASALAEMARVVRPGGRVFILEFFPLPASIMGFLFEFYFKRVLPLIGGLVSDGQAYRYLPDSVASMPTLRAFCQQVTGAGLQVTGTTSWLFGGCCLVEMQPIARSHTGSGQ